MICPASGPGRNCSSAAEIGRPSGSGNCGPSMILPSEVLTIFTGHMLVLTLHRQGCLVPLVHCLFFLPRRTRLNAAMSTVIADRPVVVHDHGSVINIRHIGDADVGHGTVVIKLSSAPFPAVKSHARVAETVVNSTVETNVRSPVSCMPQVKPISPSPVSGRPQHANGRDHPGAGHPVVAVIIVPSPVARRPEIARAWADGLRVNRQWRRPHANRDPNRDLRKRCCRKSQNDNGQYQPTDCAFMNVHDPPP